ncbi:MAG: hypothetical protein MUO72_06070 [Bacteroidales bacterium]|nr:hypothetical protein [Bacteroidales bacterium]
MKTTAIILSFFICANVYPQKQKEFVSIWNNHGNEGQEIPGDSYNYFKKGKLYYYLSNDRDNIYLDLKIDDPEVQTKILKQGMTVWINTDGKQVKKTGVRFPLGTQNPGRPGMRNSAEAPQNIEGNPNSPINQANTIELIGFTKDKMNRIPAHNTDNFRGSVRYNDEGILLYRLVMPIAKIEIISNKSDDEPTLLTFGIEEGPLMMGMGPGGGGSGGGAPATQPAVSSTILWIKDIRLATEE